MAERRVELTSGAVFWAKPDPGVGREQAGRRPVVIVAGAEYHDLATTLTIVVPVTSADRGWPNHLRLSGILSLTGSSFAMVEQVKTISRERLGAFLGTVDEATRQEIRLWVSGFLEG